MANWLIMNSDKSGDPKKGYLVVDEHSIIPIKLGSHKVNYDTKTITGEITLLEPVMHEKASVTVIEKVKRDLEYSSVRAALVFADRIEHTVKVIPEEEKVDSGKPVKNETKVEKPKEEVKSSPKEVKVDPPKQEEVKKDDKSNKPTPPVTSKVRTPEEDVVDMGFGQANVTLSNYADTAYFIGHTFMEGGEEQVAIFASPMIEPKDPTSSFWIFFTDKSIANDALSKLLKHPKHKDKLANAKVFPATDINSEFWTEKVMIVRSSKKFYNWISKVPKESLVE